MTWLTAVGVFLAGFASGAVAGMFGVGGASLTTPSIRLLGATPIEAVGSTVPAMLPGALSGTWRYSRSGLVNWRIGLTCGLSGSVLAVGGAWVAEQVDGRYLMVLTAALIAWTAIAMLRENRSGKVTRSVPREPVDIDSGDRSLIGGDHDFDGSGRASREQLSIGYLMVVGSAAGFLAGLLGIGGGVVMVPTFTRLLRIPIKEAVASSLVSVAIFSIPVLVAHAFLGNINWTFAGLLTLGVVPGAQVGSRFTLGLKDTTVRVTFGLFLLVIAFTYGVSEVVALL